MIPQYSIVFARVAQHFETRPALLDRYIQKGIGIHEIAEAVVKSKSDKVSDYGIAQFKAIVEHNLA